MKNLVIFAVIVGFGFLVGRSVLERKAEQQYAEAESLYKGKQYEEALTKLHNLHEWYSWTPTDEKVDPLVKKIERRLGQIHQQERFAREAEQETRRQQEEQREADRQKAFRENMKSLESKPPEDPLGGRRN